MIVLPNKFIKEIELTSKLQELEINNLLGKKLEFSGRVDKITFDNIPKRLVLNTNSDLFVKAKSLNSSIDFNQIKANSVLMLPKESQFAVDVKRLAGEVLYKTKAGVVADCEGLVNPDSENIIELNGLRNELLIEFY